jgi:uncharacterized protein YprB with RNaseH-like and TPR domain
MITLDIETSGLYPSPTKEMIDQGDSEDFLVAIGVYDGYNLHTFSSPHDSYNISLEVAERDILSSFCNFLSCSSVDESLLTYNGISFDIPFITTKLLKYGGDYYLSSSASLLNMPNVDLIRYSKFVTGRLLSKDDACRKLANLYVPRKSEGLWSARIYKNPQFLTENDHLEMLQHNTIDLTATTRFYNVVKRFPDFQEWRTQELKMIKEENK